MEHAEVPTALARPVIAGLVVFQGAVTLALVVLSALFLYEARRVALPGQAPWGVLLICACLGPQVALSFRVRTLTAPSPRRGSTGAYLLASALAVLGVWLFFHGPAHDVALWFGSHGRFGCTTVDAQGNRTTWLDDRTLPWLLSLPTPLTLMAWRFARRR